MKTLTQLSTSLLIATSLVACVRDKDTFDTAESALDAQESVEAEGNVLMAAMEGADVLGLIAPTAEQVSARIAANVEARYSPAGCAVATATGAAIVVQLDGCSGPRGLVEVTGQLDLAVSVALGGAISVHATGAGLQVNRAVMDLDAEATYAASGTTHTLAVTTQGTGVGPRGNEIDHGGDYTTSWDSATQCRAIAGDWSTELSGSAGSARRSTSVDVERCAGSCPTGSIVRTRFNGATLTVTFDGTSTAQWSTSGGASGAITLPCP